MMKNFLLFLLFLYSFNGFTQELTRINTNLGLSDSLTNSVEIRVYQGFGITNYTSVFRMFKNESDSWKAEFCEHFAAVPNHSGLRVEKRKFKPETDFEYVFQNLLRSNIQNIPSDDKINWKFAKRNPVKLIENQVRGKVYSEYSYVKTITSILDGTSYTFQFKDLNKTNTFHYSNPESYLKIYPEVDELMYVCEMISLLRNQFGIWKD